MFLALCGLSNDLGCHAIGQCVSIDQDGGLHASMPRCVVSMHCSREKATVGQPGYDTDDRVEDKSNDSER